MIAKTQDLLIQWHALFRSVTTGPPQNKILEEASEFLDAEPRSSHKLEEAADVVIVVLTQLTDEGFTVKDLLRAVQRKLNINLRRKWRLHDDGTVSHIKGEYLRHALPLRLGYRINRSMDTNPALWLGIVGVVAFVNLGCLVALLAF